MEQLFPFFILTGTNHLTSALFLFSSERQMTSNNYLKSKDVIPDKNNVQNFGLAKG